MAPAKESRLKDKHARKKAAAVVKTVAEHDTEDKEEERANPDECSKLLQVGHGLSSAACTLARTFRRMREEEDDEEEQQYTEDTSFGLREKAKQEEAYTEDFGNCASFDDMELDDNILRGLYAVGFEKPRAIQQQAIVPMVRGRDVVCQARSGTGKTAVIIAGALQRIDVDNPASQVLILTPSRERAFQIRRVALAIGHYVKVKCHLCIGGKAAIRDDIIDLIDGRHMIVGTPGRIYHLMRKKHLRTEALKMIIIDEADQLQPNGFRDEVQSIFWHDARHLQVCIFTGTMTQDVLDMVSEFTYKPKSFVQEQNQLTLAGIRQYHYSVKEDAKFDALCDLLKILAVKQTIIYCSTRRKVDYLKFELSKKDFRTSVIHADLDQDSYDSIMRNFRSGSTQLLLSTGLIASSAHVRQARLVINYDFPHKESYLQRVGCSGTFHREGLAAISFVTSFDKHALKQLELDHDIEISALSLDEQL